MGNQGYKAFLKLQKNRYVTPPIRNRIKKAGLSAHLSLQKLLLKLSRVHSVAYKGEKLMTEVSKHVRGIREIQAQ